MVRSRSDSHRGKHHAIDNQVEHKDSTANEHQHLGHHALLEGRRTAVAQMVVAAQQTEKL